MNLTTFHKLLISLSIALSFGFAYWALSQYSALGAPGYLATAIGSFAAAWGLAFYLVWFVFKTRRVDDLTK